MLPLLCMSTFFNASALKTETVDQDQTGVIYVSSDVQIFGTEHISNATINTIKSTSVPKKISKNNPELKYIPIAKQIIAKKNEEHRILKKLQDKIDKKIVRSFYSSSSNGNQLTISTHSTAKFGLSSNISKIDFSNGLVKENLVLKSFKTHLQRQKFYTSLSHLQFRKFRSSSLRAPPEFS